MTFRLLSLDGGGIRGYMTSLILERLLERAGAAKILSGVDGFAGTSTGGLISIALATGSEPAKLVDIYRHRAPEIFTHNSIFDMKDRTLHMLLEGIGKTFGRTSGPGIFESQYTAEGLKKIAAELVQDQTLADIPAHKMIAINSVAMQPPAASGWRAATFTNRMTSTFKPADAKLVRLADVALATSAAPSYFPPHEILTTGGHSLGYFADGGTFANNPVMNGIEVALSSGNVQLKDIQIISIGTGSQPTGIPPKDVGDPLDWGALDWFGIGSKAQYGALLEMALEVGSDNLSRIAKNILGNQVIRLDPVLKEPLELDGHSERDYELMLAAVDRLTSDENPEWRKAVTMAKGWYSTV